METSKQSSTEAAAFGSPVLWHFRALPPDVQRVTIRRLVLSGLSPEEIGIRTGLPAEAVRRAIAEDECLRAFVHPGAKPAWVPPVRRGSMMN